MRELVELIRTKATVIPKGGIIKATFLNQKFDSDLYTKLAKEAGKLFDMKKVTLVLTSAASGIPYAAFVSQQFDKPFIFAKKGASSNIAGDIYTAKVHSFTFNTDVQLVVAKHLISKNDKVLIVDDVIANGSAAIGLVKIVKQAKAKIVGVISLMEKKFQGGGDKIRKSGISVKSLATITAIDEDGTLHFEGDEKQYKQGEKKNGKTKKTVKR